ncbi:MAG: helix-turn-helix domain-containing protein [Chakrabartia sp.]
MSKESTIAIPADPDDAEDRAVSDAGLERALMGRRIRKLRNSLGLSQAQFAARYSIPLANIRQYEIGRTLPPLAVRAYFPLIEAEPQHVAEVLQAA